MDPISIQVGFTPLHYASQNGHTDIVELLIDNTDKVGWSGAQGQRCYVMPECEGVTI